MKQYTNFFFKITFLFFVSFGGLWGCLEQIDVEVPASERERLTIQGKLVVGNPSIVTVRISKLFDFTANSKSPINARSVSLFDQEGKALELEDRGLGDYALTIPVDHPTFSVSLGENYYIRLETFDGRTFESAMEKAVAVPKPDQLTFRLIDLPVIDALGEIRQKEHIQFAVSTPLKTSENESKPYLRWQTEWTFKVLDSPYQSFIEQKTCYITQQLDITSFHTLNTRSLADDYLQDRIVYENFINRQFAEGLYFTTIQESLSETAYDYFNQISQNIDRDGSLFETPPGAVVTNIRNIDDEEDVIYGFFYATQQDTIRTYVAPESVGSPPFYCPPPNGLLTQSGNCAEPICCDCLSVAASTTEIPKYWEE